jgi:ligand-binding sensor domain-containing protein
VLYVGTDNGLYVSFNKGISWEAFSKNLPNVAVHDLVIQPTAKHLIVGTHGRSLYKADIAPLQLLTDELSQKDFHVFEITNIRKSSNWGRSWSQWRAASTPEIKLPFFTSSKRKVTIDIYSGSIKVNSISVTADRGFNEAMYNVSFSIKGKEAYEKANNEVGLEKAKNDVYYLPKGKYTVKIGNSQSEFEVK